MLIMTLVTEELNGNWKNVSFTTVSTPGVWSWQLKAGSSGHIQVSTATAILGGRVSSLNNLILQRTVLSIIQRAFSSLENLRVRC